MDWKINIDTFVAVKILQLADTFFYLNPMFSYNVIESII